jgi:glycosyltransferase involved in cell wall biosynthesis
MPHLRHILLNAMHTSGGGGLVYLQGILPELASQAENLGLQWHLLVTPPTQSLLNIPANITVHTAPSYRFGVSHLWEQLVLPVRATQWGCRAILSNANYGPLFGPWGIGNSHVVLHTTPRAAASWKGIKWAIYWATLRLLTRLCLWSSPSHFTVAKHVVADYARPRTARKVEVAPPAVVHESLPQGETRSPNLVLSIGDFYPQKNYPLLLQAFAKLREARPEARLLIIGRPVVASVRDEVLTQARQLGVADALTLVPGVPHTVLMKSLAQAALYVNVSSAEAFNMPVLEAMASGTPCILPESVFQREVAGDSALYVNTQSGDVPAALAIAMLGVLANPPIAQTLARRGQLRARTFTWAATAAIIGKALARPAKKQ